ncbi:metallo proteinase [Aaosphaeria arxii CBS 175.79]|uniref:Neutral protease 2 n=1 Tax=Aaosphaeria arxii CBS 175.79 TaxID=1450172 RepID=A0A6A5XYD7_9PLEO|nr:metallo proteinase [Aaosphaeria arxii CBS 175.79]KAF2017969.1 metallo proteinase [Aaosphaeria arxii CBS 175.79]
MRFFLLSLAASLAGAVSIDLAQRDSPLEVQLSAVGNTAVKASITNKGASPLRVFKTGSILDDNAVEKVKVYQGDVLIPFEGVRLYVSTSSLDDTAFQTLAPGATLEKDFDIAHAHDVSAGGLYDIALNSALTYSSTDSNDLIGTVPIQSPVLTMTVDGAEASLTRAAFHAKTKRALLQADCTGAQRESLLKAFPICASRAAAASSAALTNAAKVKEYFKSDSTSVRNTVSGVFDKIAAECKDSTSGVSKQYCTDRDNNCQGGVIAYTYPARSYVVYCTGYFTRIVERSSECHHDDQPFVTMHEFTHLREIKGTDDYGVYGYAGVLKLSATQNLNHADTYALFSNAIDVGGSC